jgi:uncharacterized cupin superfamily protein
MDSSMGSVHWDDVAKISSDHGAIGGDWRMLGEAAGSVAVGLRRIEVWPGRQAAPQHAHQGEEEIFYVLGGSGLSVQEDGCFAVGAGDAILYPAGGPAHTLVAGEDRLDVLAFGPRLRSESVRFPRIGAAYVAGRSVDTRSEHHFRSEARLDPIEVADEPDPRPATIRNVDEVEPVHFARGVAQAEARGLGRVLGARFTALNHAVLAPGSEAAPPHCHSMEEELFVVLDGDGVLLLGEEEAEHPVRPGSIVSRPAGTGIAHGFRAGPGGMTLLMYSDKHPNDMCFYPRSGKVSLRGLGVIFKPERLPFWDD